MLIKKKGRHTYRSRITTAPAHWLGLGTCLGGKKILRFKWPKNVLEVVLKKYFKRRIMGHGTCDISPPPSSAKTWDTPWGQIVLMPAKCATLNPSIFFSRACMFDLFCTRKARGKGVVRKGELKGWGDACCYLCDAQPLISCNPYQTATHTPKLKCKSPILSQVYRQNSYCVLGCDARQWSFSNVSL